MHHAGIFLEYFSEAKALSIVRVFSGIFQEKNFYLEKMVTKIITKNVPGAAVMQLSRDWGEV